MDKPGMKEIETTKIILNVPVSLKEKLVREAEARGCLGLGEYLRFRLFEIGGGEVHD